MTSQLVYDRPSTKESDDSVLSQKNSAADNNDATLMKLMKAYQAEAQVKYLHLQAEIEVLLQQLQTLKQQK
ncbi:hypothetical protein HC931_00265 [Candidatus Gracilibacteria bacterium]|jgi:hypothetical protein|nr:hypothetical protein [Candidatus Gracilibacteria bacterium]NJM85981.1 hypothetical protein [Hydrococcus sp. RU_2_2]NJP17639.1 hypothetical protein [Hydrococcus sp. CRU_1_1]